MRIHFMNMDGPENPPPLLNKNHNPQWCHILQIYKSLFKELFHVHNMTDVAPLWHKYLWTWAVIFTTMVKVSLSIITICLVCQLNMLN